MPNFQENKPLAELTTFRIGGPARYYIEISSIDELKEALEFSHSNSLPFMVIGDGSNMLVSDNGFDGLVLKLKTSGIKELDDGVLKAAAGEFWDNVVSFAVDRGLWGIENLSHIPGRVGAFAVQNVGAYGQEASRVIEEVEVFDSHTSEVKILKNSECGFAYRSSIFNGTEKGRYIILSVTIKLNPNPTPNISYIDLQKEFAGRPEQEIGIAEIRDAIIRIRDRKFPYPYLPGAKGNAGSFFKNFLLTSEEFNQFESKFKNSFPDKLEALHELQSRFPISGSFKIPTAFLMDCCGLKGLASGGAKINQNQPLVILNESGNAKAADVLSLIKEVRETIKDKTGLEVKTEPELVGFSDDVLQYS